MSQLLPLLFALACPLGMAAMMAGPVLLRRLTRRTGDADANGSAGPPTPGSAVTDGRTGSGWARSGGGR
jgi:hypothetical protein